MLIFIKRSFMMLGAVLMQLILISSFLYLNFFNQEKSGNFLKNKNSVFLASDFVFFESGDAVRYPIRENVISFFNVLSHRSFKVRNNTFFEGGMLINKYNQYLHNFFFFQHGSIFKLSLSITFRKLLI